MSDSSSKLELLEKQLQEILAKKEEILEKMRIAERQYLCAHVWDSPILRREGEQHDCYYYTKLCPVCGLVLRSSAVVQATRVFWENGEEDLINH